MPALYGMEQNASAESCKQAFDTLLSSLLAVTLIFSLTLIYQVFKHLQRISSTGWAASSPSKRSLVDRHSTLNSIHHEGAEIALVGVWMSDDINPKLIHRVALSTVDNKTLEQFTDNDGYLYGTSCSRHILDSCVPVSEVEPPVFSDPELSGEQNIVSPSTSAAVQPAYHGY